MYNLWDKFDDIVNDCLEDLTTTLNIGTDLLEGVEENEKQRLYYTVQDRGSLIEAVQDNAAELMIKAFCLRQSKHYADVNHLREAVSDEIANEAAPEDTVEAVVKEGPLRQAAEVPPL